MNITPERVKELREWLRAAEGDGYDCASDGRATSDLLAILDAAQTEPTSGEREEMVAYLNFKIEDDPAFYSAKFNYGHREREVLKAIRSLILSPGPKVVSREWLKKWQADLDLEYLSWAEESLVEMLREAGIEVEEGK